MNLVSVGGEHLPARMGASIGIDELTALLRREVTDLENDIDVIGGIGVA